MPTTPLYPSSTTYPGASSFPGPFGIGAKLYPGTITPGDAIYPGQGQQPVLQVLWSYDEVAIATPSWEYLRDDQIRSWSINRGRNSELETIDAGTCTLTLDNRDRAFDPSVNPSVRPMNGVWVREQFAGETQDMFVGYVESIDQQWPAPGISDAICIINVVDEFKVLALDALPVMNPPRDSYADLIAFDEPTGYWRMNDLTVEKASKAERGGDLIASANGTLTSAFPSPVVGDRDGFLGITGPSSIYVDPGSVGDPSHLSEIAVEGWFHWASPPPEFDVALALGPFTQTTDTYQLSLSTTNTVSFEVTDYLGIPFTVTSATLLTGVWHHIVGTISSGVLGIYIDGVLHASAPFFSQFGEISENNSLTLNNLVGYAFSLDEFVFYRHGLTAERILAHYTAASRGYPTQLSGYRAIAILDEIGSHAPQKIQNGNRTILPTFTNGQPPLEELRQAAKAETAIGMVFISRSGELVLLADDYRSSGSYASVQATFGDADELPYADVNIDYSESFLLNEVHVSRVGGATISASDSTSIARYFKRSLSLSDIPISSDTDVTAIAQSLIAKYKEPLIRITSLELTTADSSVAEAVFRRDIGDRIRVLRTPPGGGARIDQTLFIQSIQIGGANDGVPWTISWGVSLV